MLLRFVAPQHLSGSWRAPTETGLLINKSAGEAIHSSAYNQVEYRFHPPGLRDTSMTDAETTVLVVGDSFTFGWMLDADQTFVHYFQKQADMEFGERSFNFVNAAAGGWGTADYVAYTEEFGDRIKPDIVLVILNTDDIGRSLASGLFTLDHSSKLSLQRRLLRVSLLKRIVDAAPAYQFALEHSHLVQFLRNLVVFGIESRTAQPGLQVENAPNAFAAGPKSPTISNPSAAVQLGQALFLRLKAWCDQRTTQLIVLTTGWHKPERWAGSHEPTEAFMLGASMFFSANQIPYHNISPGVQASLETNPGFYLIPNDCHPNTRGSALIAEHGWRALRDLLENHCRLTNRCNRRGEPRG